MTAMIKITQMGGGRAIGPRPMIYRGPIGETIDGILDKLLIPTRDGILTSTSTATVDPIRGSVVPVNTPNGRDVWIGDRVLPGAALLAQGASTGVFGALTTNSNLASNTTAAGDYPTERTIVENTVAGFHNATSANLTLTDGVNYTYSALVKRGAGVRDALISCGLGANSAGINFNFDTLTITSTVSGNGVVVRSSYQLRSNGFVFLQFTFNSPAWGVAVRTAFALLNGVTQNYTGDGVSSLIISGYDVVQGDFARTPLAWDGSLGVSRVANLLSWNQALDTTAGTIIARVMPWGRSGSVSSSLPRIYSGTATGQMYYVESGPRMECQRHDAVASSRVVSTANSFPAVAGQQQAFTQRWDAVSNRITGAGVTTSSGTPTLPYTAATPITIGNILGLANPFDGHVFLAMTRPGVMLSDSEIAILDKFTVII